MAASSHGRLDDLELRVFGGGDRVTVRNWYRNASSQLEHIQLADGSWLGAVEADRLRQAMASFAPPEGGELRLGPELAEDLAPVIAANLQAAA